MHLWWVDEKFGAIKLQKPVKNWLYLQFSIGFAPAGSENLWLNIISDLLG